MYCVYMHTYTYLHFAAAHGAVPSHFTHVLSCPYRALIVLTHGAAHETDLCAYMYVCIYVCMYVCMYIYTKAAYIAP